MRFSYNWLQSFFDTPLPKADEIARMLTFHSFEVEEVICQKNDYIFDIDILPNRSADCFSHRGIAKEISVLFAMPFAKDPLASPVISAAPSKMFDVKIVDASLCSRYAGAVIRDVSVKPSPKWLQKYLLSIGQKPINNIVDATNFVMFHIGQPLHAFDLEKIKNINKNQKLKIIIRPARIGEHISVLGGQSHTLTENMLVIADETASIGIAGIKGGTSAEIDADTKNIIIESANFNPVSIRRASAALNLRTDASKRFENKLSAEFVLYGLSEVTRLIQKIAGGKIEGIIDIYPIKEKQKPILLSIERMNAILGISITSKIAIHILTMLGCVTEKKDASLFLITPPFERRDITIEEDVIEEIGRILGYDKVKTVLPKSAQKLVLNKKIHYIEIIRDILTKRGFTEVYTYSFQEKGDVELENPLASDKKFLRTNLARGLSESLSFNEKYKDMLGIGSINIFEIGNVFVKQKDSAQEYTALGIASSDTNILKDTVQFLNKEFKFIARDDNKHIFEINLNKLIKRLPEPAKSFEYLVSKKEIIYAPVSPYPFILRDVAVWAPNKTKNQKPIPRLRSGLMVSGSVPSAAEGVEPSKIKSVIEKNGGKWLNRVYLFDEFKKDAQISYAFRLVFQSRDRTLTDEEINKIMNKITKKIEENRDWKVR